MRMYEFFAGLQPVAVHKGVAGVSGVALRDFAAGSLASREISVRNTGCNTTDPAGVFPGVAREREENPASLPHETPETPATPDEATLRERFEERAGIMEFEGELLRAEAERLAWQEVYENLPFTVH